jgi:hypothetical protein
MKVGFDCHLNTLAETLSVILNQEQNKFSTLRL